MRTRRKYTQEMLDWVEKHQAGITRQELADRFNAEFGFDTKAVNMISLCGKRGWENGLSGRFKKGGNAWTRNRLGYSTSKRLPIGSESNDTGGYTIVKVSHKHPRWIGKHVIKWQEVNGEIPDGYMLRFLDGDKKNIELNNLICVPKKVSAITNMRNPANTSNPELNKAILLTETLRYRLREANHE